MEKYKGNKEPFIYALFDDEDSNSVLPILESINTKGYKLDYQESNYQASIEKAALVLLFISNKALEDPKVLEVVSYASKLNKTIVTIYLEEATLTPGLSMMLGQTQGILKYSLDEDTFNDKLFNSPSLTKMTITEGQKKAAKQTSLIMSISLVAVLIIAAILIIFKPFSADASLFKKLGISGNLDEVKTLYVYGEEVKDDYTVPNYVISDDGLNDLIILDPEEIYDVGEITDLSDFTQLTNLEELCICGNQIESIEPLFELKNLKFLDLSHNYQVDLSKLDELKNIEVLNISYVDELNPQILLNMPTLKTVYISADQIPSFDALENKPFKVICVNEPIYTIDDSKRAIKDKDVFSMCVMNNLEIPEGEVIDIPNNKILMGNSLYTDGELIVDNYGTINLYGAWEMGLCTRNNYGTINIKNGGVYTGGMCDSNTSGTFVIEEGGKLIVERGHSFRINDGRYENNGTISFYGGGEYYFNGGEYINNGLIDYHRTDIGVMILFNSSNYRNTGTVKLNNKNISFEDFATNYRELETR